MEMEETTEGLGDGGEGYGRSGGGPYRVPAARAPPGTTERGATERETAETAVEALAGRPAGPLHRRDMDDLWAAMSRTQRKNWLKKNKKP